MPFVCNLPLFMIIASLFSGVLCLLLKKRAAHFVSSTLLVLLTIADAVTLYYTARHGAFTYTMGEFPAPWGNEIRAGALECLILLVFLIVMICSLSMGYKYLLWEIDESKYNLYCALLNLASAAVCALVFTNDIFTGYVFLEILTLASCGLMVATEIGKIVLAGVRYMIMNLLGSSLFLLGVVMLYGITGHLLMVPMRETMTEISADPTMMPSLMIAVGILTIGLAIKSGLFPFYFWMPDTYGWSTPTTAAFMSSVVSKAYIFLLIKVYWRVVGIGLMGRMPIHMIVLILGIAGAIFGSLSAIRANDVNRMVAYSSAAQIGYIFMSIGIGTTAGYAAAVFHLLGHTVTKSMLFLVTPRLEENSGDSMIFKDLQGSALRDRTSGLFFTVGALSMTGIPVFAGFSSKFMIMTAAADTASRGVIIAVALALMLSTILNALYFIRTVIRIYTHPENGKDREKTAPVRHTPGYLIPAWTLVALNVFFGLLPMITYGLINHGFGMLR
ncbi:MAG: sodium:proton antiporter [Lachnospiraceae bacterium]|nr:sodium:proton antiporter [Lachnospiraceae bacterium]